jgi:hypothetical protein
MLQNVSQKTQIKALAGAVLLGCAIAAPAQAVDFSYNGFATAAVGKTISGVSQDYMGVKCPCFISNYPEVGVYENEWNAKPDSKLGLQGTAKITDKLSLVGQVVFQGGNDFKPVVDWAYASYDVSNSVTVQAGRKRLPLFAYSDYFDVGYSYPWMRPPGDLYGWQIVAYNGANVMYKTNVKGVAVTTNVWTGKETDHDNRMLGQIYYGDRVDETWKDIIGGYVDLDMDVVTLRAVAMTNKVDRWVGRDAGRVVNKDGVKQNFYGLSSNVEYKNVVLRTEINRFERPSVKDIYSIYLVGAGYRMGNFLPMVTYSSFKEDFKTSPSENEIHNTTSVSLRWDVKPGTALKVQYDDFRDKSAFAFVGNSKTVAVSIDQVF